MPPFLRKRASGGLASALASVAVRKTGKGIAAAPLRRQRVSMIARRKRRRVEYQRGNVVVARPISASTTPLMLPSRSAAAPSVRYSTMQASPVRLRVFRTLFVVR